MGYRDWRRRVAFNHWDDIEAPFPGARPSLRQSGFGIGRRMLNILRSAVGNSVSNWCSKDVDSDLEYPDADLIIASDGIRSERSRNPLCVEMLKPDIVTRPQLATSGSLNKPTPLPSSSKTEHSWFQAHIYKVRRTTTTFIVECPEPCGWPTGETRPTRDDDYLLRSSSASTS